MLKDDFDYYTANQEKIVEGHIGKYVVIKHSAVLCYFKNEAEVFEYMKDNELGTFLVKKCQPPGTDVVTIYNNMVA